MAKKRWPGNAGIAIGPILFIIAILAILAAAIAAGSGSFTASTHSESNKTRASGMIQVGENLKVGMDRLVMENGLAWGQWNINAASGTSNANDLFSPTGGGISSPSTALAGDPGNDIWYYPKGAVPQLGTTNEEQLAVLNVDEDVCNEINNRIYGISESPTGAVGDFTTADVNATSYGGWPTNLHAKSIGCVADTTGGTKYYFYQVLYVQ